MLAVAGVDSPLLGLWVGGPRQEDIGAQKDQRVEHHTSKSSLKVSQRSSGSLAAAWWKSWS